MAALLIGRHGSDNLRVNGPAIRRAWPGPLLVLASLGSGQEGRAIQTEVTLDFATKYVWHGLNLVNDSVFQPQVSFSAAGVTLSLWGSMEMTNWNTPNYVKAPKGRFSEVDATLQYDGAYRSMGWTVGIVDYQFPGTGFERYREWFGGISFDEQWGAPWICVFTGDNDTSGTYATVGLSHAIPARLGKAESLNLAIEVAFGDARSNRFLYGYDGAAITDVNFCLDTEFDLGSNWTFKPALHGSTLLHPDLLRSQPRRSNVWASFSFGFKF